MKEASSNFRNKNEKENELPFPYLLCSSATAGAASSFITNPLDMVKLRLQVQRQKIYTATVDKKFHYEGTMDGLIKIYKCFFLLL